MSVSDKDRAHMRRLGETLEATDYAHADSESALALAAADRGEIVGVKLSHETVRQPRRAPGSRARVSGVAV